MEATDNLRATSELEETFDNLKANIESMEAQNARQTNELKKMVQDLTLTVSKIAKPEPEPPQVECPVCMEFLGPPIIL